MLHPRRSRRRLRRDRSRLAAPRTEHLERRLALAVFTDNDLDALAQAMDLGHPQSTTCGCAACAMPPPEAFESQALQAPAEAQFPLSETFRLHSRPSAAKRIYLDFDGHTASGTAWGSTIVTPSFSLDSNYGLFSDSELTLIQDIWARVAEDFAPFDVDVTTEEPSVSDLINSGGGDTRWGVRAVVGGDGAWRPGAAGVAFLNSFGRTDLSPAFVFADQWWKTNASFVSVVISHEVGHTLGLGHHGYQGSEYYGGRGDWGPLMGNPNRLLTQWSNGDYGGATNQQDDLTVITTRSGNGFGYRPDDHGNTPGTATAFAGAELAGVIERSDDVDLFRFYTSSRVSADIRPASVGANLDILAEILDASGTVVAASNPLNSLAASFNITVGPGTYFLRVQGTGQGDPATTGYSRYGSLGQYTVDLTVDANPAITSVEDRVGTIRGVVANGGRMNDPSPLVRGIGPPGATINLTSGGFARGTATADATGAWEIVVAPPLPDGTHQLFVADSLGGSSTTAYSFTVDTLAPTVNVTRNNSGLVRVGEIATITLTFSETVTDFTLSDVVTVGGMLSGFTGSGSSYTAIFTPTPGFLGTATVGTAAGAFADLVGNPSAAGTLSIPVDAVTPTVSISRAGTGPIITGASETISFTLSTAATDFTANDILVSGGSLTAFRGSGTSYTATFTPADRFQGNASVTIPAGSFSSASGNPNQAASLALPVDTAPPTLTISRSNSGPVRAGMTDIVTFSVSEPVTTFTAAAVTVTGGSLSGFSGSGTTYTATFTPAVGFAGMARVSVAALAFADPTGQSNTGAMLELAVDTVPPTVVISRLGSGTLTVGSTATLAFTLSEPVAGFSAADISVTGGLLTGFTGSGTSYTATFVPAERFRGSATVTVAAGAFTDAADNPNDDSAPLVMPVDTIAPSVTISRSGAATLGIGSTATITFTLSEPSANFTASDVTVAGGSLSAFSGSGANYSAIFTPAASFQGVATIVIAAASFTNPGGNANAAASFSLPVDTIPPTVTIIRSGSGTLGVDATAVVTFTLSKPATDFSAADILVTGGSLAGFGGSGTTYTATFVPAAMMSGTAVVTIPAAAFTDSTGNPSVAATSLELAVDTVPPTVVVSRLGSGTLTVGSTATLAFTLSEPVAGFNAADISVTGGLLTGFTGSGTSYTATFVPAERFSGQAVITVPAGAFTDAAGNPNASPAPLLMPVDTIAPVITSFRSTRPGARLGIGDKVEIVATISDPVTPGGRFLVRFSSGGVAALVVDRAGTVASGLYTAQPGEESPQLEIVSIFEVIATVDTAGNQLATMLPQPSASLAAQQAVIVDAAIRFIGSGAFGIDSHVVADAAGQFRRVPIRFTTPVRGVSVDALQLAVNGRSVPLAGARLQGSGANYVLLLPMSRGNPVGIYTLSLRPGHTIRATVNGASASANVSLHWGYKSSIGMLPSPPSSVTHQVLPATGAKSSVLLTWQPARGNGGGTVTQYIVEYRIAGTNRWIPHRIRILGSATTAVIGGLAAGRNYEFRLAAQNSAGIGELAISTSGTSALPATRAKSR